jgi:hypothetical protein
MNALALQRQRVDENADQHGGEGGARDRRRGTRQHPAQDAPCNTAPGRPRPVRVGADKDRIVA